MILATLHLVTRSRILGLLEQHARAASQMFPAIHQRLIAYGFDFRALGFEQFKDFMLAAQARWIVKVEKNGLHYSALLPEEEVDRWSQPLGSLVA